MPPSNLQRSGSYQKTGKASLPGPYVSIHLRPSWLRSILELLAYHSTILVEALCLDVKVDEL